MKSPLELRDSSCAWLNENGIRVPAELPLLDLAETIKTPTDVRRRVLGLNVLVACAHGFPQEEGRAWLEREGLIQTLSVEEVVALNGGAISQFKGDVEAIHALLWVMNLTDDLRLAFNCGEDLVRSLPNLRLGQTSEVLPQKQLRPLDELRQALDTLYCMHWFVRDRGLEYGRPLPNGNVRGRSIAVRRHSLEWVLSLEQWDDILLDT